MPNYKCLIIDDDPLVTDLVLHYAEKCDLIDYCVSCNDSVEGAKLLVDSDFDILFLDYNMPKLNGQDILELKKDNSKVIMITSNSAFAVNSYQYDLANYLLKPLDYDQFFQAIQKIESTLPKVDLSKRQEESSILVKDGSDWVPVLFKSISFIKSESNYCTFYTTDRKVMSLINLKKLEEKLPENFIRCHRSYIVNMQLVKSFNLEEITVDQATIPISAMYKENIKRYILTNA